MDRNLPFFAWHQTNLFSPRERAALNRAEVITRLPGRHVFDTDFVGMRPSLDSAGR